MKIALKWTLMMVLGVVGLSTFTSCGDDKDDTPPPPSVTEVNGAYSGKMTYKINAPQPKQASPSTDPTTTTLDVTVKNDTIYFEKFPADGLIKTIIPDATMAEAIIKAVGDIKYKVGFKSALNAKQDSISLEMAPKPLMITYPISETVNMAVEVIIEVSDKGIYSINGKDLKFNLKATKAMLGESNALEAIGTFSLSFDMKKK